LPDVYLGVRTRAITWLVHAVTIVKIGVTDCGVKVASHGCVEARVADVDAHNQCFAEIKSSNFDHTDRIRRTVDRWSSVPKCRSIGLVGFLDKRGCLVTVKAQVAILAALLTIERRRHATYSDIQDVGVTDTLLAVVLGVEI